MNISMNRPRRRRSDINVSDVLCRRFGTVAVRKGFVTLEQVKQAMFDQLEDDSAGREHRLLGSILYDHGYMTEDQIEQVLADIRRML